MESDTVRLNKFLAERVGLSRREADEAIQAGKVTIDGKPATLGDRVDKNVKVCYNGEIVPFRADFLYLALNKPVGYLCSRRSQGGDPTVYALLPKKYHDLKTVGRLDRDSSGLILLTNDGDFAFKMTHPKFQKKKIYEVTLDKPLAPLHQQEISDFGIQLPDGVSKFPVVRDERHKNQHNEGRSGDQHNEVGGQHDDRKHFIVTLSEGRNRQIRRTFAALGYTVVGLHRVQFGPYALDGLKPGEFVEIDVK